MVHNIESNRNTLATKVAEDMDAKDLLSYTIQCLEDYYKENDDDFTEEWNDRFIDEGKTDNMIKETDEKDYSKQKEVCVHCGSSNIEYGDSEPTDESYGYEYTCNDCGKDGIEWHDLVFSNNMKRE